MPLTSDDEQVFREWERKYLDKYHESLPLWSVTPGNSIFGLLALHDSFILAESVSALLSSSRKHMTQSMVMRDPMVRSMQEGVSQAMRWLVARDASVGAVPIDQDGLVNQAYEFVSHAEKYVSLSDLHKMYGRGLADVEVSRSPATVTFSVPSVHGAHSGVETAARMSILQARNSAARNTPARMNVLNALAGCPARCVEGRIVLDDPGSAVTSQNVEAIQAIAINDMVEISGSTRLADFDLCQFDLIWTCLWIWSFCAQENYVKRALRGDRQSAMWPTQVNRTEDVVRVISDATAVPRDTVQSVLYRMAFDSRLPSPDLWLQPLIFNGSRSVIGWSARLFLVSRARRNLLKLLARVGFSDQVANAVGQLADPTAERLVSKLKKYDFAVKCNLEVSACGESGEIDILAWHRKARSELLIVECKGALPPDEVAEVAAISQLAGAAKAQLEKCIRILQRTDPGVLASRCPNVPWREITSIHGLIVFFEGVPGQDFSNDPFPATDLPAIMDGASSSMFRSPSRLVSSLGADAWQGRVRAVSRGFDEIDLGQVTYRVPFAEVEGPVL